MASRIHSEPFASIDAAWLHMETPTNMAMITSVMMFDEVIDFHRLQATIEHRMLQHERFRQRVKEPALGLGLPRWETDPYFDLSAHLHRVALPAPGDMNNLQALVSDLMSTPLDFSKPLWQCHLVENCDHGCAIVFRLHHCIADGLALVQVLLDMTDRAPNAPWPAAETATQQASHWLPLGPLFTPAVSALSNAFATAENLVNEGAGFVAHPARFLDLAKLGVADTLALGKLGLSLPDRKTLLKGECGVTKRAVWCDPIPLDSIKAISKAMGSTINDVLTTAMTGALRRYLEEKGQPTDGLNIRAMVPVSVRQPHEMGKLGNRFGLVLLALPVGIADTLERLLVLKQRMDDIKASPEAIVAFGILGTMGLTPVQIEQIILDFFAAKATVVMTNVPGPRDVLYYAGRPIRNMMFWVPTPGHLGMGLSIYSYNGSVTVGVATDSCLVPDPERIVEGFHAELAAMKQWLPTAAAQVKPAAPVPANGKAATLAPAIVARPARDASHNGRGAAALPLAGEPVALAENGRCQALTAAGRPCKNRALPGSTYCRVHAGLEVRQNERE